MKTFIYLSLDAPNLTPYAECQSSTNPLINNATQVLVPAMLNDTVEVYHFNIDVQVTRSLEWVV